MRLLRYGMMAGLLFLPSSHAFAGDSAAAEIRTLKTKLKELEDRVNAQGGKERRVEAQSARPLPAPKRRSRNHVPPGKSATRALR